MTEQEIKEILQSYVNQEMETVREDEMPGYEHVYSKKYEEKKNRLFFDERKFGKKFYFEHHGTPCSYDSSDNIEFIYGK